jgi:hypothetical protein
MIAQQPRGRKVHMSDRKYDSKIFVIYQDDGLKNKIFVTASANEDNVYKTLHWLQELYPEKKLNIEHFFCLGEIANKIAKSVN